MSTVLDANSLVAEIMSNDVLTVRVDDALHTAMERMLEYRISALPVVDDSDRCVGIVSMADLIELTQTLDTAFDEYDGDAQNHTWACAILRDHFGAEIVESVMTQPVHTLHRDATVREAARLVRQHRTHHVPIVGPQQQIQGMLSTFDLVKVLAN